MENRRQRKARAAIIRAMESEIMAGGSMTAAYARGAARLRYYAANHARRYNAWRRGNKRT